MQGIADDILEGALNSLFGICEVKYLPMPEIGQVENQLRKSSRSSKSSCSDEVPAFIPGNVVFAHKGQSIPYWRPGVVMKAMPRGHFLVKFFGDLVELDCTKGNMMPFADYERRKWRSKVPKMFTIPHGEAEFFQRCVDDAKEKAA